MVVKNLVTSKTHTISDKGWEAIKGRGDDRKYEIVSTDNAGKPKQPKEAATADYEAIIKNATKLFKEGNWQEAKEAYTQASVIKATPFITNRLAEIEGKLNAQEETTE